MKRLSLLTALVSLLAVSLSGVVAVSPASADTGCPTVPVAPTQEGGTGPYLVQTKENLQYLKSGSPDLTAEYRQTGNIDMQVTPGTDCVWDRGISGSFSGTYDGAGFEISGLNITTTQAKAGLFEDLTNGTVKRLGFTGNVTSTSTSTYVYVGALAGYAFGARIEDSYATGNVESSYTDINYPGTGGLVGYARSGTQITGSHATGDVTAVLTAGGLVGRTEPTLPKVEITSSYSTGNVRVSSKNAGGLAGVLYSATVTQTYATGNVTATAAAASNTHLGAFAGTLASTSVTDSFATGGVSGGLNQVGGFVGDYGSVATVLLSRTYSVTLSGFSPQAGATESGGFVGYAYPPGANTATTSFWNYETSGYGASDSGTGSGTSTDVVGRSTSELTDITTYTDGTVGVDWNTGGTTSIAQGFDSNYTWGICSAVNDGYPFLTAFYSTDPCANPPSPSAGDYSRPTATFHFRLNDGQECAPISPQLVYTNTRYILPGANAPCRTPGSELIGWSVPHQDWDFAPGATVFVVESQVFTAVLRQPTISVTWNANVSQSDTCLVDSNGSESNATSFQRTSVTYVDRPGMSDYPSGDRPSLTNFLAPNAAPCSPPGLELTNWELASSSGDIVVTPGESIDDAIAQASPNGGINDFTFRAQWGLPQQPREISRAGFFVGTSDELTDSGRQRLRELQQAVPVGASDVVVEIIGMSESLANSAENEQLALKRADVVKRTLESGGLLGTYLSSTDPSVIAPTRSGSGKALTTVRITYLAPAPAV